VTRERERVAGILRATQVLGFPEMADELVRSGVSLVEAQDAVMRAAQVRAGDHLGPKVGGRGARVGEPGLEGREFRQAAVDALVMRAGIAVPKAHPAARDLPGSVLELARIVCSRHGLRTPGSNERLVRNAMTTSDFPLILADAAGKALRMGFEEDPGSHRTWVRVVGVRDFKSQKRPILGSAPELKSVLELGEYQQGPMSEESESYSIGKFGRIVALSWETLVNDDLSAFLRIVPALGQAARRIEADTVYALLTSSSFAGPTLSDGKALFHDDHANITEAADGLDATVLNAGRALLRKQTALGGGYMNLAPRFLIVSPEHETTAEQLLASATRVRTGSMEAGSDAARPEWIGSLTLVVEPRLSEDYAYLATMPTQVDTIELGVLEENLNGPTMDREDTFVQDRIAWKVRHVFGAKALDFRGLARLDLNGGE
jgi:hypothetical protein